jgi:hypothetical protein
MRGWTVPGTVARVRLQLTCAPFDNGCARSKFKRPRDKRRAKSTMSGLTEVAARKQARSPFAMSTMAPSPRKTAAR